MPTAESSTRKRIVEAGLRGLVRDGLEDTTMATIAEEAGVSKALLHYHFEDRAALFAEIAALVAGRTISRESIVLDRIEPARGVDALWEWMRTELERGEVSALLALGTLRDDRIAAAVRAANQARLGAMIAIVTRLFENLALTPRIALSLIGGVTVSMMDGLACGAEVLDARGRFDAFWLGMLSLAD